MSESDVRFVLDIEIQAMANIAVAMEELSGPQAHRVATWAESRWGRRLDLSSELVTASPVIEREEPHDVWRSLLSMANRAAKAKAERETAAQADAGGADPDPPDPILPDPEASA